MKTVICIGEVNDVLPLLLKIEPYEDAVCKKKTHLRPYKYHK